jgi:hypothetical protein
MTTTTNAGLKVKTSIKAGGFNPPNHNRAALKVRTAIKAGFQNVQNHNTVVIAIA